jgi:hypothetical protein
MKSYLTDFTTQFQIFFVAKAFQTISNNQQAIAL